VTRMRRLRDEEGIALVMALLMTIVISVTVTSSIYLSGNTTTTTSKSRAEQVAFGLAEAGINNAMALLANPANNAMNASLLGTRTTQYEGGSVTWSGTLDVIAAKWTLYSKGTARLGTAGGGTTSRTISAKVPVYPTLSQPLNNPAWNYVFSRGGPTSGVCDTVLGQSVDIKSPFFVQGNLCMQNTATVSSGPLVIGGSLTMTQTSNRVGQSGAPISELQVGAGCKWRSNALHQPCQNGAGSSGFDNVWANTIKSVPDPIDSPVPLWDDWYLNASPGPFFPCTTSSGTVPVFDSGAMVRDNSVAGVFHLTPAVAYTCKTAMGELSWNPTTKVLKISGTIFIDGSAKIENGQVNTYDGYATLYLSGTLLVKNSKMCALVSGSACTTQNWNPNARMLVVVANGSGGQLSAGNGIELVSAGFQGALFATNGIDIGTTSLSEGPLNGRPVKLGQSSGSSFPGFTLVPAGMPGNPAVYAQPGSPESFSG
jgi:hypothetical protein